MKYNVGDVVKVKEDLVDGKKYDGVYYFHDNMREYCGNTVTIEKVYRDFYEVKETSFVFSDSMLEDKKYITKEKLEAYESVVRSEIEKWGKEIMKDFEIANYKVCDNDGVKTVVVTFKDGAQKHAVCCKDDHFDLTRGIEVCVLKYVLGEIKYKKLIRESNNQVKALDKAEEKAKKDTAEQKAAIERKQKKAAKRRAKRLEKQRKARVEEMKEAYLAAMKEFGNCVACESFLDDIK